MPWHILRARAGCKAAISSPRAVTSLRADNRTSLGQTLHIGPDSGLFDFQERHIHTFSHINVTRSFLEIK